MREITLRRIVWIAPLVALALPGCTRDGRFNPVDMWNQTRYKPYAQSEFFKDGASSRTLIPGTIARGQLRIDEAAYAGTVGGKYVTVIPSQMIPKNVSEKEFLQRGQERFNVDCSPCHGLAGRGNGMIIQRGFPQPPDYALARLQDVPIGHFFDVMTNGYGAMYSYADRVEPVDRWAIAAYIRYGLQPRLPRVQYDTRLHKTTAPASDTMAPEVSRPYQWDGDRSKYLKQHGATPDAPLTSSQQVNGTMPDAAPVPVANQ